MAEIFDTPFPFKGEDLTGKKFGRLTVLGFAGRRTLPSGQIKAYWQCRCDCGNVVPIASCPMKDGRTASCGCFQSEEISKRQKTHGMSSERIYKIWKGMIKRCHTKTSRSYPNYGGRGIVVEEPWRSSFESFYSDMGEGYRDGLSIEREDNNGNYCKGNCHWATMIEQGNNKRNNIPVTFDGRTQNVAEWAREVHFDVRLAYLRISRGWDGPSALGLIPNPRSRLRANPGVAP